MKKFIIIACALMLACVSCSESKSDSSGESKNMLVNDKAGDYADITEDEMPFGATMSDLRAGTGNVPVSVSYDNRFMSEDEARKISDYISAVNTCDAELMKNTCYPSYLDHLVEQYESTDVQDYLDTRHKTIADNYVNGEFDFDYIIVNSLMDENDSDSDTGFSILDAEIYENSPDAEITSRKMVGVEVLYTLDGQNGSHSFSAKNGADIFLYIYTIDGQMYIL